MSTEQRVNLDATLRQNAFPFDSDVSEQRRLLKELASTQPLPVASVAPDWSLMDVNPNSPTHGQAVSPRGQLGRISAWYFGHAT